MIDLTNINPGIEIKTGKSSGSGFLFFILLSLFIGGFYFYNKFYNENKSNLINIGDDPEADS